MVSTVILCNASGVLSAPLVHNRTISIRVCSSPAVRAYLAANFAVTRVTTLTSTVNMELLNWEHPFAVDASKFPVDYLYSNGH
jgi:hypothetical protein